MSQPISNRRSASDAIANTSASHTIAVAGWTLILCTLAGCQSYRSSPIDLSAHAATMDDRWIDTDPVASFAKRIDEHGDTPSHFDTTDGITSAEAEVFALFYNTDLRRARMDAGIALAQANTAGMWADPVFGFDAAEILSPANPIEFGFSLSLTIPISGRLDVERDRANAVHSLALQRVAAAEWMTRNQVRQAWATWSAAKQSTDLLENAIQRIRNARSLADRLAEAGELNRAQARLFAIELADQRGRLVQAQLETRRAKIALLGILGLSPDADAQLISGWPEANAHPTSGADDDRLVHTNLDLSIDRAAYAVAEETLRLAIREQYPDITIGAGYGSENRDDRLLLGLSLPIPSLNANRPAIEQARARRQAARVNAETTFERVQREAADARARIEALRAQRLQYETEIIPLLDAQISEINHLATLGEVDAFVTLETVTRTVDAKLRLLNLRLAEVSAVIELIQVLGPEPVLTQSFTNAPLDESAEDEHHQPTLESDEGAIK